MGKEIGQQFFLFQLERIQTGDIVWEWHLWDHLIQDISDEYPNFGVIAEYPELFNINCGNAGNNADGLINILDIVSIVNLILNS